VTVCVNERGGDEDSDEQTCISLSSRRNDSEKRTQQDHSTEDKHKKPNGNGQENQLQD